MNITRNRQTVSFTNDSSDADIVQTSQFLNSAGLPIPTDDYLINGMHVVASTGPLARQAIREYKAQAAAASADVPTYHPGRCYCAVFAGGHHVPGMTQPGAYGTQCKGDRVAPHDASTCGACLAGATDYQPLTKTSEQDEILGELLSAVDDVLANALDQGYYHDNLREAITAYRKARLDG
jgi:hypothetical protein